MTPRLDQLRRCFEGAAPALLATCSTDGTPNVTCVSQVHFVDDEHVALSFQFLNKTRENILANPAGSLLLLDPCSGARYRLAIEYARTESEGPLFECMRARLASIASHTGMAGVFRLLGADVYKVAAIEAVPGPCRPQPERRRDRLAALRTLSRRLAAADELETALDLVLEGLAELFGMQHALVLCSDESGQWLYTVASHGYAQSGVGSEVALGEGVIGVAAQQRTPIRLNWPAAEYAYGRAVRAAAARDGLIPLDTEISFPGLIDPQSQLAAPIEAGDWLAGVLYVESAEEGRFDHQDEDALVTIAQQLGVVMRCLIRPVEIPEPLPPPRWTPSHRPAARSRCVISPPPRACSSTTTT
ncbi:GAF domain-containing protein [Chitinimonas koreensis]|uniref:GAF domain-containing protein n=1 Tax=Chitinimonas koreensis TaxID=356302 RepID=UPI00223FF2AA|nr:GAF domain-containing protein [Chitinimonas koreensis]